MIRKYIKYSTVLSVTLFLALAVQAQVSTLYFMKNASTRHEMNPAYQPISNLYIDLPIIPSLMLSAGTNSLSLNDFIYPVRQPNGSYKTVWFKHSQQGIDDFYNQLKDVTRMHLEQDFGLLSVGLRYQQAYFTLGVKQRFFSAISFPKDMFTLPLKGSGPEGAEFNLDDLAFNASTYTEIALGYSREIDSRLTVGGKVKLLLGQFNSSMKTENFRINTSRERWDIDFNAKVNITLPSAQYIEKESEQKIHKIDFPDATFSDYLSPQGVGAALDLGATYKLLDNRLTLSASVLDLGFIRWSKKGTANLPIEAGFYYDGLKLEERDGKITDDKGNTNWFDDYFDSLGDSVQYTTSHNAYTTSVASKILIGGEYSIMDEKMTFGLLSKNMFTGQAFFAEITASANYFPVDWFDASLSYSLINGRSAIGLGLGTQFGPFNFFIASDYALTRLTKEFVPSHLRAANFQLGGILTFGRQQKKSLPPSLQEEE
ncbi:MAG: DUF5723 family protein [Dysgonamonadaceae bacterium]|jgi:hypothetical protein|nr:DUF5723 family protein [Dysgonamonadaceae bacterium]